jgi:hypothetical protein
MRDRKASRLADIPQSSWSTRASCSATDSSEPNGERRVPRFVISWLLNHSEEKNITSVYDRYSYDAEKKAAMDFWSRQLTAILKRKPEGGIGRFRM